jgi:glutamate synthase domain-containing protein 3
VDLKKSLAMTDAEKKLLEERGLREEDRRTWDRNEVFDDRQETHFIQDGKWPEEEIVLRSSKDRSFGARLCGERIRAGDESEVYLRTTGFAGNSYAVWGSKNMHFRHRGFAEAGFAKGIGEGCTVSLLRPPNVPLHMPIVANNVGFGATEGSIFVDSITGQRCGIRLSGKAKLFSRGGGQYSAEYMTGGRMMMLPDPRLAGSYEVVNGLLGSGMSGGEVFVFVNRNQNIQDHLPKTKKFVEKGDGTVEEHEEDNLEVVELTGDETRGRFFALLDHFKELGLSEAEIAHWKGSFNSDAGRVVCVRPKGKK